METLDITKKLQMIDKVGSIQRFKEKQKNDANKDEYFKLIGEIKNLNLRICNLLKIGNKLIKEEIYPFVYDKIGNETHYFEFEASSKNLGFVELTTILNMKTETKLQYIGYMNPEGYDFYVDEWGNIYYESNKEDYTRTTPTLQELMRFKVDFNEFEERVRKLLNNLEKEIDKGENNDVH